MKYSESSEIVYLFINARHSENSSTEIYCINFLNECNLVFFLDYWRRKMKCSSLVYDKSLRRMTNNGNAEQRAHDCTDYLAYEKLSQRTTSNPNAKKVFMLVLGE